MMFYAAVAWQYVAGLNYEYVIWNEPDTIIYDELSNRARKSATTVCSRI